MKATISKVESFLNITVKCSQEGADLHAKINAPGSPPGWSGPLDPKEFGQLCFRLNQISNGALEIEGAQDYLAEYESFEKTVRHQAEAIDGLVKRAEVAEAAAKESLEAVQNQREVIEGLKTKADAFDGLVKRAEEAEAAAKEGLEAIQNQREVIDDLRNKLAKTDDTNPINENVQSEPLGFGFDENVQPEVVKEGE